MTAEVAAEEDRIAGANGRRRDREGVFDEPDARGGDVEAVALAAFDDLGVAGDDGDAGGGGGGAHGGDDALQGIGGQTLFENEGGTEPERTGAAHAEIVDGAVDGELADVAAGEKERADDVGIGGEREAGAGGGEDGAVVLGVEGRMREGGAEEAVDQVLGEGASAAVADGDFRAVSERDRAGREGGGGRCGVGHALKLGAGRGSAEEKSCGAMAGGTPYPTRSRPHAIRPRQSSQSRTERLHRVARSQTPGLRRAFPGLAPGPSAGPAKKRDRPCPVAGSVGQAGAGVGSLALAAPASRLVRVAAFGPAKSATGG